MAEFAAVSPLNTTHLCFCKSPGPSSHRASFPCRSFPLPLSWKNISVVRAKKKKSQVEPPILEPSIIEEVTMEEEEDEILDQFEDEVFQDGDDYFEEYEVEDSEPYVGDGGEGGGISLAGTWWDKEALAIAEEVSQSFDGDLKIYAFKTSANSIIQVRIEKLSNKYGSPSMTDIEEFSSVYRARLDKAEIAGSVPENLSLEDNLYHLAKKRWRNNCRVKLKLVHIILTNWNIWFSSSKCVFSWC
ncbi:PREDICTED: uncharacterized protein LOC104589263 isoform X2 [Nelumbo nucifera]|uniref:Uncharacterized protein LOC104589263 isoform X2 n=1 Tax=Nelumbo nucifera TaxID=4432 RepID=A0A1U7ZEF3_NELNU|nr:PREDICTED: uncharacterized protein LOC104589263 isoform X2 [Nelumbo nucifera]